MDFSSKYFIAESGKVLKAAEQFRKDTIEWREKAYKFLEECGATSGRTSFAGKFFTIKFKDGRAPDGFKKPDSMGYREPYKKNKEWIDRFNSFDTEPQVKDYMKPVINCPESLRFKNGFTCIGHPINPYQVCWYAEDSPLLVVIPDVEKSIEKNKDRELICDAKNWKPPQGLKEILREEWDLWVAKHKNGAA